MDEQSLSTKRRLKRLENLVGGLGSPAPSAVNKVQALAPNAGPSATVSYDTAAITKAGSGEVLVIVSCSGITVGATEVDVSILRDGAVLAGAPTGSVQTQGNENFACSIAWVDTLPDGLPHTYGCQAHAAAGNLGFTAGQGSTVAIEQ